MVIFSHRYLDSDSIIFFFLYSWLFTDTSEHYCKRCYFRVTKFSRLAAQKHIRGLLNSRWADAHLSFWYCTMLTSFNEWYIYMYVCNWIAQKQSRSQTDLSITHLHQRIWSIHNSYASKMCIQNIANIFAGFCIRACRICAKYAKINVPRIFPLLQYTALTKQFSKSCLHQNC